MEIEKYAKQPTEPEMTPEDQAKFYEQVSKEYAEYYKLHHTPWKRIKELRRNDPCPCGSGKKYKHCCYDKDKKEFNYSVEYA